jgi:hypothetical protein
MGLGMQQTGTSSSTLIAQHTICRRDGEEKEKIEEAGKKKKGQRSSTLGSTYSTGRGKTGQAGMPVLLDRDFAAVAELGGAAVDGVYRHGEHYIVAGWRVGVDLEGHFVNANLSGRHAG